jgi:hypothetical protein
MIKLNGVKTKKNIKAITIGAIILPSVSPKFIQILLSGLSSSCFKKAIIKKIKDRDKAQNLIVFPSSKGQIDTIKKTSENKIPKLFSDDLFISFFYSLLFYMQPVFKQPGVSYVSQRSHLKNSKDILR